ncbi:MAG: 1-deoxy-D-xylulose-5-phosphate reductoisomerase [Candidatus Saganbacteria bacterium]|uniref:1-deoxy-D-xylulose 5-phosphate reductoisomerase n=1 Tax=Candidatus Saganbacteria bacterium TaxID=2575572 RepID=A0A833NRG4_UNCSA|nr:MAG: 1-deoxy-D-xylulose-5-phosphate reductoisomerase [Candidatus Saganbacteria bacterium]
MKKIISILGSTGSIGRQVLEVVSAYPSSFRVAAIAAKDEVDLIAEQINKFNPSIIAVESEKVKEKLEEKIKGKNIYFGEEGLFKAATAQEAELLVAAVPGSITLVPIIEAIRAKKNIALATKEVLVASGDIFMEEIKNAKVKIFPIDSEHSAVAQCLAGEKPEKIKKIILTASGGPFLKTPVEKLAKMTAKDALAHPTWKMGAKITIDSATLMNKGFEVIEAHYLFGVDYSKIEVVVHPQSIIHSMVEFIDGSIKAQLSNPDMRIPIQYALFNMERVSNLWGGTDLSKVGSLTFQKPDLLKFPCLGFAYEAGKLGGTMPAVLNAANEEAVNLFLKDKISYNDIAVKIKEVLNSHKLIERPSILQILEADSWARAQVVRM